MVLLFHLMVIYWDGFWSQSQHAEMESRQSVITALGVLWLQFVREPGTFTGKVAKVNEPVGKTKRRKIAQLGTELQKTPSCCSTVWFVLLMQRFSRCSKVKVEYIAVAAEEWETGWHEITALQNFSVQEANEPWSLGKCWHLCWVLNLFPLPQTPKSFPNRRWMLLASDTAPSQNLHYFCDLTASSSRTVRARTKY